MEFVNIKDKKEWQYNNQFLQSWLWGNFQQKLGRKIWRLAIRENGKIIVQALIIKNQLPLGFSYLYCPRGPLFQDNYNKEGLELLINKIKYIAIKEKAFFFRIEPLEKIDFIFLNRKIPSIQPNQTTIMDLSLPEDEILKKMHSKTRYNIHLAKRKGVTIHESDDIECFWDLLKRTTKGKILNRIVLFIIKNY